MFKLLKQKKVLFVAGLIIAGIVFSFMYFNKSEVSTKNEQQTSLEPFKVTQQQELVLDSNSQKFEKLQLPVEKKNKDGYIVECAEKLDNQQELDSIQRTEKFLELLKQSNTFKSRLGYAILLPDSAKTKITLLQEILAEEPTNELAAYNLLAACKKQLNNSACKDIENNLINIAPENAAFWTAITALHINKNDSLKNIAKFLQKADLAIECNDYFYESLELLYYASEEVVADSKISLYDAYASMVLSESLPPLMEVAKFCREHASQNQVGIAELCLSLGRKVSENGNTMSSISLGLAMQKIVYEKLNDKYNLTRINNQLDSRYDANHMKTMRLMMHDGELFRYWLEKAKVVGERQAYEYAVAEAIRLSENENYNPCGTHLISD